ncbi:hypothetical protein AAEX28_00855 [Lentisphaerota bacterium WC36G]|nr:hypothetical protein LJT99_03735 [Lentisphaerae bacterium WC36]
MAVELQGLLNKLQEEGVKKADQEKQTIIDQAKQEAAKIVADAKKEAEAIVKNAQQEEADIQVKAKAAVNQASRDIIIGLQTSLQERLNKLAKQSSQEAMTPEFMQKVIAQMVEKYADQDAPSIEVMVAPSELETMTKLLTQSLIDDMKINCEVVKGNDIAGGLKVSFDGADLFLDCTEDAITQLVASYVGPRLADMIK